MAENKEIKEKFNEYYQCKTVDLCKALGITVKDYNEFITKYYNKDNRQSFNEVIQLTQLKTLLEIKDILLDSAIDKATRLRPMK